MVRGSETVVRNAVDTFGTTTNFAEAGYILRNGEMLDFSNAKKKGERDYDHRAIALAYGENVNLNEHHGAVTNGRYLEMFVDDGNIRIEVGDPDLDIDAGIQLSATVPPTTEQLQTIRDFLEWKQQRDESFKGDEYTLFRGGVLPIGIDFGGDSDIAAGYSNKASSLRYVGSFTPDRIINDIKHYYQTGEVRQQSVVSQFHESYQIRESTLSNRDVLELAAANVESERYGKLNAGERDALRIFRNRLNTLSEAQSMRQEFLAQKKDISILILPNFNTVNTNTQ